MNIDKLLELPPRRGIVKISAWKRGKLLWQLERENTIVTAGLTPIAKLVGGTVANQSISVIGFGSGAPPEPPPVTDIDLAATPAYYKAITSVTFPTPGQAQFNWDLAIGGADSAAVGMTITELGFFANTGAVSLPIFRPSGAAPALTMVGHIVWPSFTVVGGGAYVGTWTFIA